MSRPLRIVLDTDIGSNVDDALALALALRSPELELAAITTVGSEALSRARIGSRLLELAGRGEIPVHAGCRVPLLGGEGFRWFGHEGEGLLEPTEEPPVSPIHAVDALRALLHAPGELHVVTIGPLTNLAAVLILEPELVSRIESLTVMGGSLRGASHGGRVCEPAAEYNLSSDPHASQLVFGSGVPLRLVSTDVTLQTWLTPAELVRLRERSADPLLAALVAAVELWTPVQKALYARAGCELGEDNLAFLHDPLALASLYDPSLCRFETLELEPQLESGRLRTLERPGPSAATRPVCCATAVDAARFRAHFIDRIAP